MVSDAVVIDVLVDLFLAGELLGDFEGFPDRAGVSTAATDVVDLRNTWCFKKFLNEARHIMGVNVIADLLALVTKDFVFPALKVALDEVRKETVQLDTGVVRAR